MQLADVILEVLDARDPLGCRCREVEQKILAKDPNKKIILIVNKIGEFGCLDKFELNTIADLVPKENVEAWLKYLRNEFPTIAFKCSTQVLTLSFISFSLNTGTKEKLGTITHDCHFSLIEPVAVERVLGC